MERDALNTLIAWKNQDPVDRKPLLLKGARQTGKTWLMHELQQKCFDSHVYINFDADPAMGTLFQNSKEPGRLVEALSMATGRKIIPGETLLMFDEIQECPEALASLKYFREQAPLYHVIAAGSLLGTLLARPASYPVGMVRLLRVYPLSFREFLRATNETLFAFYETIDGTLDTPELFHARLLEAYNQYLVVGGMPECVTTWLSGRDPQAVSSVQQELVELYESDISKHSGRVNSGRILLVLRSISSQLAKPNEKFMYGAVRKGGRAREFEEAIEWLVSAGLADRVNNVSKAEAPLAAFDKLGQFKIFFFDTGLLGHMAGVDVPMLTLNQPFQFSGPLTENYVLQQLRRSSNAKIRYFADKGMEIDFLLQHAGNVIPIEVKAGRDKSAPSFKRFMSEHRSPVAVRFSRRPYRRDGDILNIPLYMAAETERLLTSIME